MAVGLVHPAGPLDRYTAIYFMVLVSIVSAVDYFQAFWSRLTIPHRSPQGECSIAGRQKEYGAGELGAAFRSRIASYFEGRADRSVHRRQKAELLHHSDIVTARTVAQR